MRITDLDQPVEIVAAINRVRKRQERDLDHEWARGIAAALSSVLVAMLVVLIILYLLGGHV